MSQPSSHRREATAAQGAVRSLALLMRWLLVLLVVFDQVGSPLHRHRHDGGVDGSVLLARSLGSVDEARQSQHESSFFHAITALRNESRFSAQERSADDDVPALLLPLLAVQRPLPAAQAAGQARWAQFLAPRHAIPLSLPPGGRAPPLQA